MKTSWLLLMKKRNIESWKKASEWSDAEKISLIDEGKKKALMKLLSVMKLSVTV